MNILKQEGAYSLSIDKDGKAVFTVGDVSVTSKEAVNDGTWKHIAGIREKNGSLKVYVNGTLDASRYEKNIKDLKDGTLTVGGGTNLHIHLVLTEMEFLFRHTLYMDVLLYKEYQQF